MTQVVFTPIAFDELAQTRYEYLVFDSFDNIDLTLAEG